jgi:hypothetical protein
VKPCTTHRGDCRTEHRPRRASPPACNTLQPPPRMPPHGEGGMRLNTGARAADARRASPRGRGRRCPPHAPLRRETCQISPERPTSTHLRPPRPQICPRRRWRRRRAAGNAEEAITALPKQSGRRDTPPVTLPRRELTDRGTMPCPRSRTPQRCHRGDARRRHPCGPRGLC